MIEASGIAGARIASFMKRPSITPEDVLLRVPKVRRLCMLVSEIVEHFYLIAGRAFKGDSASLASEFANYNIKFADILASAPPLHFKIHQETSGS